MKHPRQWLFNILAGLSLLLFLAMAGLWLRSHWVADFLLWRSEGWASLSLSSARGSLDIMRAKSKPDHFEITHESAVRATYSVQWAMGNPKWSVLGFACYADPAIQGPFLGFGERPIPFIEVVLPIWPFLLLFGIPPLLWWYQRRFSRPQTNPTICSTCGYDLRATPDRCPECGTIPKKSAA